MNGVFSNLPQSMLPIYLSPFYIDPYSGQYFFLYRPIMNDFCLNDIDFRYDIIRKFTAHTDKIIKMLLQIEYTTSSAVTVTNGWFHIARKDVMYGWIPLQAGAWIDLQKNLYGTDIISLYANLSNTSYHKALRALHNSFQKKEMFGESGDETKWHIQEKHTVALDDSRWRTTDPFFLYFDHQLSFHQYVNR